MPPIVPDQASTTAVRVDALFYFLLALACFFAGIVTVLVFTFSLRYRRRAPNEVPRQIKGSDRLEIAWTVIPLVLAMIAFFWGAVVYLDISTPPEDSTEVYVIGRQWMWKFVHASGQEEINELHVPVNKNIKLTMTAQDVIHDVSVPDFRVKNDVLPERYTTVWFNASKVGQHHLFCSQYCGTNHAEMVAWVYVMTAEDFQKWQSAMPVAGSPTDPGAKLFQALGCASCHKPDASGTGPSLAGLFGSRVKLADGSSVVADETYIRESIVNPNAKVVAGYQPVMPTYQGRIDEDEMVQLIAYGKSLKPQPVAARGAQ